MWNDAVLLARERYEPKDMTVANDVPVPALDLCDFELHQSFKTVNGVELNYYINYTWKIPEHRGLNGTTQPATVGTNRQSIRNR